MFAGFTFLPVYFQSVMMDSALMSGVKLFPLVFTFLLGAGIASAIMQKTGKIGYLIPLGAVMLTLGMGLLALIKPDTNFGEVAGYMLLFGFGIGIIFALVSVTLQNSVSAEQMGVVMSAFAFFQLLGGSIGVAIVGALMNHWTATYIMENPTNPLLGLCLALDNVFIASVAPGIAVCILSIFIQNIQLAPDKKLVAEMDDLEKATPKAETDPSTEKPKQVEEPAPVVKDPQVERALAEARDVIERKKSRLLVVQQGEQEATERREINETEQQAVDYQNQTEIQAADYQPESPKTQPQEETEEEMEKRIREKQLLVETERELEAQRQREAELLDRAQRAMDTEVV